MAHERGREEPPRIRGEGQRLRCAGAAVRRDPTSKFFIHLQPAAQQWNHWNMKSPGIFKSVTSYLPLYHLYRKPLLASWESLQSNFRRNSSS
ncbi:hypothetical protein CapIbe_014083 [Capra ibex]